MGLSSVASATSWRVKGSSVLSTASTLSRRFWPFTSAAEPSAALPYCGQGSPSSSGSKANISTCRQFEHLRIFHAIPLLGVQPRRETSCGCPGVANGRYVPFLHWVQVESVIFSPFRSAVNHAHSGLDHTVGLITRVRPRRNRLLYAHGERRIQGIRCPTREPT